MTTCDAKPQFKEWAGPLSSGGSTGILEGHTLSIPLLSTTRDVLHTSPTLLICKNKRHPQAGRNESGAL